MKIRLWIKRLFLFLCILSLVSLGGCIFQIKYSPYKSIQRETEEMPTYVGYDFVYIGNKKIYLGTNENVFDVQDVFCVNGDKIYFVHSKPDSGKICLASVDVNTEEYKSYYEFDEYERCNAYDYRLRNGYCYDQVIVLNDQNTVVEFDTRTQEIKEFSYEEYEFPKLGLYGEYAGEHTVRIVDNYEDNYESGYWSLEAMATESKSIKKLWSFYEKENLDGTPYLERFFAYDDFYECVTSFDDKVYAVGNALNFHGASYAIILEYNNEDKHWRYVTDYRTGGLSYGYVYVIPHY